MITQMSINSKVYHRNDCKYLSRIKEEFLTAMDIEDNNIKNYIPCKCCCSLKNIYKVTADKIGKFFKDTNIIVYYDNEADTVFAISDWYKWSIKLIESDQHLRLYKEHIEDIPQNNKPIRCDNMDKVTDISIVYNYIAAQEKLACYHDAYKNYALQMEYYAKKNNINLEFDESNIYILTDMAAWKIAYVSKRNQYKLLHCPFMGNKLSMKEAKIAHYHIQMDVSMNQTPYKHLLYISKHDVAKKIESVDYKLLPNRTRKQKKYYQQAKNRSERRKVNRVMELFKLIENNTDMISYSIG